jgi:hypothetical protein
LEQSKGVSMFKECGAKYSRRVSGSKRTRETGEWIG